MPSSPRPTSELAALVPAHVRRAGLPPRVVAPAAAGLGVAAWTSVGLYPPFDDGRFRVPVTIAAGALAAAFVVLGARSRTVARAAVGTCVAAVVGGAALAFACGLVLTEILYRPQLAGLVLLAVYAAIFGGAPSLVYVSPLVLVTAGATRARLAGSADAHAESRRRSGLVLATMGYVAALFWWWAPTVVDHGADVARLGFLALPALASAAGVVLAVEAQLALVRRRRWLARVRAGRELFLVVRPRTSSDEVGGLPRLTGEAHVLELVVDGSAYRASAVGTPLALV